MTFVVIILLLTLVAAVWMAADLLRPSLRTFLRPEAKPESGSARSDCYAPVSRLLARGDFAYLADEGDLVAKLRKSRLTVLRMYLTRIRRDYLEVWSICRLLAPISPDPAFASQLTKQYWSFHWAYWNTMAHCFVPAWGDSSAPESLVRTLTEIREQARGLLAASEPAMAAAPSAA